MSRSARLSGLQDDFQNYLLAGTPDIERAIVGTTKVPADVRLAIYAHGYRARLIEALELAFALLANVLEDDFEPMAVKYLDAYPSTFASIRYFGHALASFLASDADYAPIPLLAEIAAFEWAMAQVFDAPDAEPIGIEAFAPIAAEEWEALRFEWSPTVRMLGLEWNVPAQWKAVSEQRARPDPELAPQRVRWLLWRTGLQIYFRPLAADEAAAVELSIAGRSFGELCAPLCAELAEQAASMRVAGWLRGWMESGLIVGVRSGTCPAAEGPE